MNRTAISDMNWKGAWHSLATPVERFLRWWTRELVSLVPKSKDSWISGSSARIITQVEGDSFRVVSEVRGDTTQLGSFDVGGEFDAINASKVRELRSRIGGASETAVHLRKNQVLRQVVRFPSAVSSRLDNVIKYEMDRLTPYTADQVYCGHRVVTSNGQSQSIDVELTVTPKSTIDPVLARLKEIGLIPSLVTVANDSGGSHSTVPLNLLSTEQSTATVRSRDAASWLLGGACVLLLIAVFALPFVLQQRAVTDLDRQIEAIKDLAINAAATRDTVTEASARNKYLSTQREGAPAMVAILDKISRILPDDTWITRLEVSGTVARLQGESDNASALIGLVESATEFEEVRFYSPITQNKRTGKDRFALETRLVSKSSERQ